jgi:hypothetical protein
MPDDFSLGLHPDPEDISGALRERGVDPGSLVEYREVDPREVGLLEGWVAPADPGRAREIARRHETLMPVLVFERPDGSLQVANGAHRVEAARIRGDGSIGALVAPERAIGLVFEPYGAEAAHRWAHHVAGTRWDP